MQYKNVLLVDAGGFVADSPDSIYRDVATFMMDGMKLLSVDAVGLSEHELKYGVGFLKSNVKRSGLNVVCANLFDKKTHATIFPPYVIKIVGNTKVGIFGLMNHQMSYGPSADSLIVEEPTAVAARVIPELKKKGATVIVLLSQLGKVESEDLVTAVDGIDALIIGHNVPLLAQGRMIKNTVACYGGEQGQYIGRTILTLDAAHKATTGENTAFILSPDVGERADIAKLVKAFEDGWNEKLRVEEKKKVAEMNSKLAQGNSPDRFLGAELCTRCHTTEADQWKNTPHAHAWQTLVDAKKDATPDCIPCHVLGYQKQGGFQGGQDSTKLANVQCESCHGMGTEHDAFATPPRAVTAETCTGCHTSTTSPTFNFATYQPHILHHPPANMPVLPGSFTNGSNIFAVLDPSDPSANPFTPPIVTHSLPKFASAPRSANSFHSASGQRRSIRTVSFPSRAIR
jgi:hypothetical protein